MVVVDGKVGPATIEALQKFLNDNWSEAHFRDQKLAVDGQFGADTIKALQTFLTATGQRHESETNTSYRWTVNMDPTPSRRCRRS